jgi:hypothetical protein
MRSNLAVRLGLLSVAVGVGAGLWASRLTSLPSCSPYACPDLTLQATFATWVCALFGASAAIVVGLVSLAVTRLAPQRAIPHVKA